VYSAGLILFELLTGTKAFTGELPVNVAFMHVHEDAPRVSSRAAGTPTALDDAVATAASRDPDARPADALAFRSRLARVRAGLTAAQLDRRLGPSGPRSSADTRGAVGSGASTAALPVAGRAQTTASIPTSSSALATTPPRAVARRRRRWPWVLVALSAALLAATLWAFTSGPLEPTPVPKLAGSEVAKAHEALAAVGLTGRDSEAFSEDIPAGVVISSPPTEGTTVWKWNTVDLVVSKGQERYAVPTLAGATLDAGLQALRDARLSSGTQGQEFSETVPEGSIISSDPVAGTPLPPGGAVNLVVSKGRQPIPVPNLAGKGADEAQKQLEGLGLKVVRGAAVNSDTVPEGAIVSQNPNQGTLFKGDTVTIVVSKGPVLVQVPNVVGMQRAKAVKTLEDLGFKVAFSNVLGGFFNTVRASDPGAGSMARKGSTVTLTIV
jgi:serine/threonine-protein kinase